MIALIIIIFALVSHASAIEFSTFNCFYVRQATDQSWIGYLRGSAQYKTELGYNESVQIFKVITKGNSTGELGFCSYVSSNMPEDVRINIEVIEGKKLDMHHEGCLFAGEPVKLTNSSVKVTGGEQYTYGMRTLLMDGKTEMEQLHIAGVRPFTTDDPLPLCSRAFTEITKLPAPSFSKVSSPFIVQKAIRPGTKEF